MTSQLSHGNWCSQTNSCQTFFCVYRNMFPQSLVINYESRRCSMLQHFSTASALPTLMQRPQLTHNSSLCHHDTCVAGGIILNTQQPAYDGWNTKQMIKTCKDPTPIKTIQPWILFHTLLIEQALIYSWKLDAGELWHACSVIQEIRNRFCDKPDTSWPGLNACLKTLSCSTLRGGVCSALSSLWTFSFISTE